MNKNNSKYIKFSILSKAESDKLLCPSFDSDTATTRDKEEQWMFYFAKHSEEVTEVLKGAEDVLCAHLTWMFECLPAFAEAMVSDDLTAGSYISIGNKTLHSLCVGESKPSKKSYIRFSDNKSMDEIAKEVHEAEITPKLKKTPAKKTHKEKEETVIHTSQIENDGVLYEEIYNSGAVAFIDGDGLTYDRLEVDGVVYEPINGDELKEGAVLLPMDIEDYGDEKTLIEEIKEHIHKYVDVSPFFETISAYYVLLTWLYDEVNTLPYLRALGDTGCGKSRYEDVVGRICYKATIVSGAITPAPIYRLIRKWRGTLIIDEGDFKASDEQNEVVKILNCGFERGRPVVRSQKDNPDNLQFLPTFSPKILSSRRRFKDVALESRCLTEVMRETNRDDIPYLLPEEFYGTETSLRNKLLKFRFVNHGHVDILKAQKLKAVKVEDRLKQAVSSFIVLFANNEEIYAEFVRFLEAYNEDLVEERFTTYEGGIIHAIYILVLRKGRSVTLTNVTNITNVTEAETVNGEEESVQLTNDDITGVEITATLIQNTMTEELGYKEEFTTSRSIGRRLRVLGITTKRVKAKDKKTKALLILEARQLTKLFKKYLPVSIMTNNDSYDSYMCYGKGGENEIKKVSSQESQERGICELCGNIRKLAYEMKEGGMRLLICSECAKDQIEMLRKADKTEASK